MLSKAGDYAWARSRLLARKMRSWGWRPARNPSVVSAALLRITTNLSRGRQIVLVLSTPNRPAVASCSTGRELAGDISPQEAA